MITKLEVFCNPRYAFRILTFFIIYCYAIACTFKSSGTWKDEDIDRSTRQEIAILNNHLLKSFKDKDVEALKSILSDKLIEIDGKNLVSITEYISSAVGEEHSLINEFYVKNQTTGVTNVLSGGKNGSADFLIRYQALSNEMYVSLLLVGSENSKMLITAIYGKQGNDWKINILQIGQFSLFKFTALEYYEQAKLSYSKSHLVDAVNLIELSMKCLSPANQFIEYNKSDEIKAFYNTLLTEVKDKYKLPLTLTSVPTQPKVFSISLEVTSEGFYPMIGYLSNIDLTDTPALTAENEKIKSVIGQVFTGIDQNKKYIFYRAFNEIPNGTKEVRHYGFVDKQ